MSEQLRVRFVVSLDADERDVISYTMDELFQAVSMFFPGRNPSVGIAIPPNEEETHG